MDTYKTIFSGRLEFGSARSFEQVQKMFEHRTENYYRNDILLSAEDIFDEKTRSLDVPRFLSEATVKSWKNTVNLLEYTSEFAIAGRFYAWRTSNGKMIESKLVEPSGDKSATQAYWKGRKLIDKAGKENEAKEAFSRAIEKFERHALAYERRGYVNFQLKNYEDAIYDFTKSANLNPNNADPHYGRARIRILQGNIEEALPDLEITIRRSIPHQPLFYIARRIKGDIHMKLKDFEAAANEYRFFTLRKFDESNPNFAMRSTVYHNYGKALLELEKYEDAIKAFDSSLEIEDEKKTKLTADSYLLRGLAKKKKGAKGFRKDWERAVAFGSKKAKKLLEGPKV